MKTARKILVTGASGFIGSHIIAELASRGDSVRALYRRQNPPEELRATAGKEGNDVELFNADLCDESRVLHAVQGIDVVIHTAALASDWGKLDLFIKENFNATVSLLKAARDAGVKSFIYFSSAVVHGFGPHIDTDESGPYYPIKYPYQISKRMTEEYVLRQNSDTFQVTILRPCNVYGPGDRMSTYAMYEAIMDGVFGYIGSGETLTCPIYIDDLCAGTLAALESPNAAGQVILLTDGMKVSWKKYCHVMFDAVGSKKKPAKLPRIAAYAAAKIMTIGATMLGSAKAPPLTMYRVEQASQDYHFSNAKAGELLGFTPKVYFEDGLRRTAKAFLEERSRLTR